MKNRILESLILAVAIVVFGSFICCGLSKIGNRERTVSVRGLAEKEVQADKVFWSVRFSEVGNEIPAIYRNVEEKDSLVIKFFLERGIDREDITVNAPDIADALADRYREKLPENRYTMTSTITVASTQVKNVRKLQSEIAKLAAQGIALDAGFANYEFTGLNAIKPEMIEEATKNARAAAEKFAKDSDSELGKIRNAQQGVFSIDDRDENTPYIKKVRVVTYVDFMLDD